MRHIVRCVQYLSISVCNGTPCNRCLSNLMFSLNPHVYRDTLYPIFHFPILLGHPVSKFLRFLRHLYCAVYLSISSVLAHPVTPFWIHIFTVTPYPVTLSQYHVFLRHSVPWMKTSRIAQASRRSTRSHSHTWTKQKLKMFSKFFFGFEKTVLF